jgi:hypothetical protein
MGISYEYLRDWKGIRGYIFLTYETIDIIGINNTKAKEEETKRHTLLKNLESGVCTLFSAILYTVRRSATTLEAAGLIPNEVIGFLNWRNPSSLTVALGLTQPVTEMNTRNLPGSKGQMMHNADDLTTICDPIV